jgi:hypothetical protein
MRVKNTFLFTVIAIILIGLAPRSTLIAGDCEIGEIDVDVMPCDETGHFDVVLDFEYAHVGDNGFKVQGNGNVYGIFQYTDLPVTIGPLFGDGTTIYEFVVRDMDNPDCTNWTEIDPVDCEGTGGDCSIWDLVVDDNPCMDDGFFTVYLDFEYENVGGDGFKLFVNDDLLGIHLYEDLPLTEVGPFEGDGETVYNFFVRDVAHAECNDSYPLGPIDCEGGGGDECDLWGLDVEVLPCNEEGYFMAEVGFEHENTSEAFLIWVNGIIFDDYGYDDLPVTVGPLEGDGETVYHFVVADVVNEDCATNTHIEPVDCEGTGGDCFIGDPEATVLPCNEDDHFFVLLDFEHEHAGEAGFRVVGNGNNYGNFEYEDLPVEIGPLYGDGSTVYEFVVIDNIFEDCTNWTAIDPVDCTSAPQMKELTTEIMTCDGDQFEVKINFVPENVSGTEFAVEYNSGVIGYYQYSDLPVTAGPFTTDGETFYYFIVRDLDEAFGNWMKLTPFTCESLGLEEGDNEEKVKVWLDVNAGQLVIEVDDASKDYTFLIVDPLGRGGIPIQLHEELTRIPYWQLPRGMMIYRVSSPEGVGVSGKVFVH